MIGLLPNLIWGDDGGENELWTAALLWRLVRDGVQQPSVLVGGRLLVPACRRKRMVRIHDVSLCSWSSFVSNSLVRQKGDCPVFTKIESCPRGTACQLRLVSHSCERDRPFSLECLTTRNRTGGSPVNEVVIRPKLRHRVENQSSMSSPCIVYAGAFCSRRWISRKLRNNFHVTYLDRDL